MSYLTLPPPALPIGTPPDTSNNGRDLLRPWTFAFLLPDLPILAHQWFHGDDFTHQHNEGQTLDMTVESGGDTFDLCGSGAFQLYDEEITPKIGSGRYRRRARWTYIQALDEEENFNGIYIPEQTDEILEDDLSGGLSTQTRVTAAHQQTVWEYLGTEADGAPPHFGVIGHATLSSPVTIEMLEEFGVQWQRDMDSAPDEIFDSAVPLAAYSRSQSGDGQHARLAAGMAVVRSDDVEPTEIEEGEYTLLGIRPHFEFEARQNAPVVYEEDGNEVIGNAIYGTGSAVYQLSGLISQKIWKDIRGTFDEEQAALASVPWVETTTCASVHAEGYGRVSRGRYQSLGGTWKITLNDDDDVELVVLDLTPDEPAVEYNFPGVEDEEDEFTPTLAKVEVPDGEGGWTLVDPLTYATIVGTSPVPGVKIIHSLKSRTGLRWGHVEFLEQDPPPATAADIRCYRKKTFTKYARP